MIVDYLHIVCAIGLGGFVCLSLGLLNEAVSKHRSRLRLRIHGLFNDVLSAAKKTWRRVLARSVTDKGNVERRG